MSFLYAFEMTQLEDVRAWRVFCLDFCSSLESSHSSISARFCLASCSLDNLSSSSVSRSLCLAPCFLLDSSSSSVSLSGVIWNDSTLFDCRLYSVDSVLFPSEVDVPKVDGLPRLCSVTDPISNSMRHTWHCARLEHQCMFSPRVVFVDQFFAQTFLHSRHLGNTPLSTMLCSYLQK